MVKMNCHANGSRDVKLRVLLDDDMNGVTITNAGVRERAAKEFHCQWEKCAVFWRRAVMENDAEELSQPQFTVPGKVFLRDWKSRVVCSN